MTNPDPQTTCRACGEAMVVVEPGQTTHPGCDDAPSAAVLPIHRIDRRAVRDWLIGLHKPCPGYLQIASTDDFTGRSFPTRDIDAAVDYVVELDRRNAEGIYCRITSLKAPPKKGRRGAATDTAALPALWADIDIAGPGHAEGGNKDLPLPPDEDAARAIVTASGLPEPTVWVHSGGGMYPMWVLIEPQPVTDENFTDIKDLAAGWQKILQHAARQLGWRYETGVGDLARVLRIPGTVNRKEGLSRPCRMLPADTPHRHRFEDLQLALADGLARIPAPEPTRTAVRRPDAFDATDPFGDGPSPGDDYAAKTDWAEILEPHGWRLSHERGRTRYWTRPGKDLGISATTNHLGTDRLHVFSTETPFEAGASCSKLNAYAVLNHGGDLSAAAKELAAQGFGSRRPEAEAGDAPDEPPPPDDTEIEEFWASRPILAHIRSYARARVVSPWATLGVALARIIAETPPHVVLPAIVGSQVSLNLFVALVGDSGAGKGGAEGAARDAMVLGEKQNPLDSPKPSFDIHGVGSGEGILHAYVVRKGGEIVQHTSSVLFSVPEVDTLTALGDRKGSTLLPKLREAWMGDHLDFAYADPTKRLAVENHRYRMAMIVGVQPKRARALLDDSDGGTPQRFIWLPAEVACPEGCEHVECDAPNETPPEPMAWPWKRPEGITAGKRQEMYVCDEAWQTIRKERLKRLRKNEKKEALDGHALLAQLKVAAALAILNGKLEIHDEDWNDAALIMRISAGVREEVRTEVRRIDKESWRVRDEVEAKRAVFIENKVREEAIGRVVRTVRRAVAKAGAKGLTQPEARRAVASVDRKFFDEAWERLVAVGDLVTTDGSGKAVRYRLRELKEAG